MGMYSDLCKGCNESIVAEFETGEPKSFQGEQGVIQKWMSEAVVLTPSGSLLRGSYNGYGQVAGAEDVVGHGDNEVWHEACWELAGSPTTFTSVSDSDDQQGFWQEELVGKSDPRTTMGGQAKMEALRAAKAAEAPVEKAPKAKKIKKAAVGVGFFIPGLDPNDPESLRKALSKLVLDPEKYLV